MATQLTKWLDEAGTDASEDLSVPNTDILESTELLQASLQSVDTTLAILTEKELRRPKESPSYYYPVWGYARTRLPHEPLRTKAYQRIWYCKYPSCSYKGKQGERRDTPTHPLWCST